jgi:xylulose-5-phosphate/fructose-6-phosphate phosphoketolase
MIDLNMMYFVGPGHGGPGLVAQTYFEGFYTDLYPTVERDRNRMRRLLRQFS